MAQSCSPGQDARPTSRRSRRRWFPTASACCSITSARAAASCSLIPEAPGRPRAFPLTADAETARRLGLTPGPLRAAELSVLLEGRLTRKGQVLRPGLADWLATRADQRDVSERRTIGDANGSASEVLAALHRVLVPAAAWKEFRGARAVTIALDGALYRLPFEALTVGPASDRAAARAWIDEGPAIRYAGSATSMLGVVQRRARAAGRQRARDDGVSQRERSGLRPQRRRGDTVRGAARDDARSASIVAAFAPEASALLSGAAATEAAVRATLAGERYLRFATHGYVGARGHDIARRARADRTAARARRRDPGGSVTGGRPPIPATTDCSKPSRSSTCRSRPGWSCCRPRETQRGTRVEGEGVFALSRAFLAASARARDRDAVERERCFDRDPDRRLLPQHRGRAPTPRRRGRTPRRCATPSAR